jgi:hypothetical protein
LLLGWGIGGADELVDVGFGDVTAAGVVEVRRKVSSLVRNVVRRWLAGEWTLIFLV